ncbi:MAG: LPS assembly protein LptD [Planctomycetota bacterium]|jgi:hypothetical protein
MRNNNLLMLTVIAFLAAAASVTAENGAGGLKTEALTGQDLYLSGRELISYQPTTDAHILLFEKKFSMSIGANQYSSDKAVVWLESMTIESGGRVRIDYLVKVYLEGKVSVKRGQGARTSGLRQTVVEQRGRGRVIVVRFGVSGEVFVTADKREIADPRESELYKNGLAAVESTEPKYFIQPEARVPEWPPKEVPSEEPPKEPVVLTPVLEGPVIPPEQVIKPDEKKPSFMYPVNIAPAGEAELDIESARAADGTDVATVIGRFYAWQKQDEKGGLLELQADNAVIFYSSDQLRPPEETEQSPDPEELLARVVRAIYLSGDVVMTEGQRTVRADEMYYDFVEKKAVAINAEMRNFDVKRGIPIYVRAAEFRQLAENKFAAENATVTTSEFHVPQLSMTASRVIITDTTPVDQRGEKVSDSSYDAQMHDIRLKAYNKTFFRWPYIRSNLQRPDIPLKSAHTSYDSDWGMSIETRWYLSRLLGLQEPEGMESTLLLDFYGKRGIGGGIEADYAKEDYFGRLLTYVIRDTGEDDLGRNNSRRNLEPPRELRGRFHWQHRHFMPYNWQLTSEVSYLSDRNFLEGYYRGEFNASKEQETLVHLKRIEDNWGLSVLGKVRINEFATQLEELPTVEYHLAGQSLFDDKFTFYNSSQVSRFRQRSTSAGISEEFFTFMSERAELDMPMRLGRTKVVPFIAGTAAFEDGGGFQTNIDGSMDPREDDVWLGEVGARVSLQPFWKVYPNIKSRVWDLNQLRHIVKPYFTAVGFIDSDSVIEQRDMLNLGISQRLETKRGVGSKERTVDWMRLDLDVTWVNDSGNTSGGPDRFIWNKPFIPLVDTYSSMVPQQDRRSSSIFGPRRNYFGADYLWRLSDTTAVLSDLNIDMQSGVVQQLNIGFSHLRWPNLSYFIGSRYLRRVDNGLGEKGSNAFTFAATYVLDPRYTVVFSQQFDFDYGANVRSDITLLRRYHRMYWGLTFSADESLKRQAIVFSMWPQGVRELGIGPRRYMGLGGSAGY